MSAYLIVNYDIEGPERFAEYSAAAGKVVDTGESAPAQVVGFDAETVKLEGSPGHQTYVVRFYSVEPARKLYEDGARTENWSRCVTQRRRTISR